MSEMATRGVVPAINDIAAALAVLAVYVVRFGTVAEGGSPGLALTVTTDFIVPVLAAVWLLVVPVYRVVRAVEG